MPPTASPAKQRISRPWRFGRNGGMRCDTAFRLVAGGCLKEVATHHKALRAGDATALHQTRIALTRLRAAISFYSPMVADSKWPRLKAELKWLSGYLGATRDLDVAIENCRRTAEKQMFRAARIESQRRLNRALGSARYRRWLNDLSDWIGSGPWSAIEDPRAIQERESPISKYHARQLRRWHRKLVKKSRGLQGMGKDKLHRLRLAGKRLRYAIEFSEGALTKEDFSQWRATVKQLRLGQQILGELNDAETRRSLAIGLEGSSERASARDLDDVKPLDRKRKSRLLRRAATVYRKLAD